MVHDLFSICAMRARCVLMNAVDRRCEVFPQLAALSEDFLRVVLNNKAKRIRFHANFARASLANSCTSWMTKVVLLDITCAIDLSVFPMLRRLTIRSGNAERNLATLDSLRRPSSLILCVDVGPCGNMVNQILHRVVSVAPMLKNLGLGSGRIEYRSDFAHRLSALRETLTALCIANIKLEHGSSAWDPTLSISSLTMKQDKNPGMDLCSLLIRDLCRRDAIQRLDVRNLSFLCALRPWTMPKLQVVTGVGQNCKTAEYLRLLERMVTQQPNQFPPLRCFVTSLPFPISPRVKQATARFFAFFGSQLGQHNLPGL